MGCYNTPNKQNSAIFSAKFNQSKFWDLVYNRLIVGRMSSMRIADYSFHYFLCEMIIW